MHSHINPSLLGQGGKACRAPVHVFRGIGPFDQLNSDYLGLLTTAGAFASLDLTTPGDGSAAQDDSDTTTATTLTRCGDSMSLGTHLEGLRAAMTLVDVQAHYAALAQSLGAALALNGNDEVSFSALVNFYCLRAGLPSTVIAIGASFTGDYSVHKDGAGNVTVTPNVETAVITWQGGNTSSNAALSAGSKTVTIIQTAAGLGGAGTVTINGVDQGALFTTWNTLNSAAAEVHIRRLFSVQCNSAFTFSMQSPCSALDSLIFQRYSPP